MSLNTKGSPLRQKGKIAELALGYGGSVGALKAMGALDMGNMENMIKININRFIKLTQSEYYNRNWWNDFICKLSNIRELRNDCCHGTSFKHNQEQKLRKLLFEDEVFKNLKVGKKIAENMKKLIK